MELNLINNRYTICDELGAGGMGVVYQATDRLTGQLVALKRLIFPLELLDFMSYASSHSMKTSLAHEFEILASLRHPHIISVLDYGFDDENSPFLTMELLQQAQPLTVYASSLPLDTKIKLVLEMLEALAYLHRRGVIHRDLKPQNVLVTGGKVKLLDFGLSVKHGQITETEGTIKYISPEALDKRPVTEAMDLYAVGVILHEMISGDVPFTHSSLSQLVESIRTEVPDVDSLEAPAALKSVLAKLLAKQPSDRYQSAHETIEALADAMGMEVAESEEVRESVLQTAPFTGREKELSQLKSALAQAIDGKGNIWLLGGESGVGKSRLLDELRISALVEGVQVLRGEAVAEGGASYQLWRDALRRLLLTIPVSDFEAGVLKEIVPDIGPLLGREIAAIPALEGHAGQQRLRSTLIEVIRRQTQPTLLLLEELHWAVESLEPVKQLVPQIDTLPILIVGTYRDDEQPHLSQQLGGAVPVMKLERLQAEAIRTLSLAILGSAGQQADVITLLQRETEGNVFFLVETLRTLAEEAGRLDAIGDAPLPEQILAGGVQQIVRRRLQQVPEPYRPLLNMAAVAGRQLDLQLLELLAQDMVLEDWLMVCQDAAVLEVRSDTWRFSHNKLREALLGSLPSSQRPRLHQKIAEAIETVYPDDLTYVAALADHWYHAGDMQRFLQYAPEAGASAYRYSDFRAASQIAERAVSLLPNDKPEKRELLKLWADALYSLGEYDQARQNYQTALTLAHEHDDSRGAAAAYGGIGAIETQQGDYGAAKETLEQSLALYQKAKEPQGVASALDKLGTALMAQGNIAEAQAHFESALEAYLAIDFKAGIADAYNSLGNLLARAGDLETAVTHYERCLEIKSYLGDRYGMAVIYNNMGLIGFDRADYLAAREQFEKSLRILRDIGSMNALSAVLNNVGNVFSAQQEYEMARTYYLEALEIAQKLGTPRRIGIPLNNLGSIAYHLKDYEQAIAYQKEALDIAEKMDDLWLIGVCLRDLTFALIQTDEIIEARENLQRGLQIAQKMGMRPLMHEFLAAYAHLLHHTGELEDAAKTVGMLLQDPQLANTTRQEYMIPLEQTLKASLPDTAYAAAWKKGGEIHIEDMVDKIIGT